MILSILRKVCTKINDDVDFLHHHFLPKKYVTLYSQPEFLFFVGLDLELNGDWNHLPECEAFIV